MSYFYVRFVVLPMLLFTVVMLLIRAQPYDDHELRQLLLPEGCPAPCFMGIRPGMTTVDEGIKLLQASGWAKNVRELRVPSGGIDSVEWDWNDSAPPILNPNLKNNFQPSFSQSIIPGLIEQINIQTTIPVGDIYLLLGEPDDTDSGAPGRTINNVAYVLALYRQTNFFVSSRVNCPLSKERFLNTRATLTITSSKAIHAMTGFGGIGHWC